MLIVKVELHSAVTGKVTEIGRMLIDNIGGTEALGDYRVRVLRRGTTNRVSREARVDQHPRLTAPVWSLVAKALHAARFVR